MIFGKSYRSDLSYFPHCTYQTKYIANFCVFNSISSHSFIGGKIVALSRSRKINNNEFTGRY